MPRPRATPLYLALLAATVALGLATRRFPGAFPAAVAVYGGDTLWAAMVFWLLALVRPRARTGSLALAALVIAFAVECSQRDRAPWLVAIRATTIGALVLGTDFAWSDLVCYAVGVGIAAAIDFWIVIRRRSGGLSPTC